MSVSNPIRDKVAVIGVGTTPFVRDAGKSDLALIVEASQNAMKNAGVSRDQIDGIVGTTLPADIVQAALGISEVNWFLNCFPTVPQLFVNAANAVFSGSCDTVLIYHSVMTSPGNSSAASKDPFRLRKMVEYGAMRARSPWPDDIHFPPSYSSWANRYFHDNSNVKREHLGMLAINGRSNAAKTEHAPLKAPLTMEDYLSARMVRPPIFGMLDMDYPVDGADAFIVTTAERAKDFKQKPVYLHAQSLGQGMTVEELLPDIEHSSHQVIMKNLWQMSDLVLDDIGLFLPYDGFTFICLKWFENVGYCPPGTAGPFIEEHFDQREQRLLLNNGRTVVNTHGGSLSDGATQGSGHIREAVQQLQGTAGSHQLPDLKSALVAAGGFFMYSGGMILRAD